MTYMRTAPRSARSSSKGLAAALGLSASETIQWIEQVTRGFPYAAVNRFRRASGFSLGEIGEWIGIPSRTMLRRKEAGRLSLEE